MATANLQNAGLKRFNIISVAHSSTVFLYILVMFLRASGFFTFFFCFSEIDLGQIEVLLRYGTKTCASNQWEPLPATATLAVTLTSAESLQGQRFLGAWAGRTRDAT